MAGKIPSAPVLLLVTLLSSACGASTQTIAPQESLSAGCDPPSTTRRSLADLVRDLQAADECVRLSAAQALAEMGDQAALAVPALTLNLYYDGPWEIRSSAAYALGEIGPPAKPAVPVLTSSLLADFVHVQAAAADALGKIGDTSAVPALALALEGDQLEVTIGAAEALAMLTGHEFPGMGGRAYELDDEGIPFVVIAAQQWWDRAGRYESWITR